MSMEGVSQSADDAAFCKTCGEVVDDVEEIAGSLICVACGTALEDVGLVHTRHLVGFGANDDSRMPAEGRGTFIREHDDGTITGS